MVQRENETWLRDDEEESTPEDLDERNQLFVSFVATSQISDPSRVDGKTRFDAGIDEEAIDDIVENVCECCDSCSRWPLSVTRVSELSRERVTTERASGIPTSR